MFTKGAKNRHPCLWKGRKRPKDRGGNLPELGREAEIVLNIRNRADSANRVDALADKLQMARNLACDAGGLCINTIFEQTILCRNQFCNLAAKDFEIAVRCLDPKLLKLLRLDPP